MAQVSVQDSLEESAEEQVEAKIEDLSSAISECTSKSNLFGTYDTINSCKIVEIHIFANF